jgi:ABC-2 type transport system permease protein
LVMTETILLSKITVGNVISNEVISGTLAYTLGRPYHYMLYNFFNGVGESVIRLLINFVGGSVLVWLLVGPMPAQWWMVFPLLLTILLAFILDFCITVLIALLAFFTEDVSGFFFIYQKILFILGGLLIPLDFFPDWLQAVSQALPFQLVLYAPAALFVNFSWDAFTSVLLQQAVWVALFGILLEVMYRIGGRKVSVNGG